MAPPGRVGSGRAGRLRSRLTFATTLGCKWKTLTGLRPSTSALAEDTVIIVEAAFPRLAPCLRLVQHVPDERYHPLAAFLL